MSFLIGLLVVLGVPLFAVLAAAALLGYWQAGLDPLLVGMDFTRVIGLSELAALSFFIFSGALIVRSRSWAEYGAEAPASADKTVPETDATPAGLIAPSLPLIIYALAAGQLAPRFQIRLSDLYLHALASLGLVALLIAGLTCLGCRPAGLALRGRGLARELREWAWEWPLLLIVAGGLYSGWLPLVDAAVVAVAWLLITRVAIRRKVAPSAVLKLIGDATVKTAGVCLLLGLSVAVANVLNDAGIVQRGLGWPSPTSQGLALLVLVVSLLVLVGTALDVLSGMALLAPIVIVLAAGNPSQFDPAGLGVLCMLGLQLGRGLVCERRNLSPHAPETTAEKEFVVAHWSITLATLLLWLAWLILNGV